MTALHRLSIAKVNCPNCGDVELAAPLQDLGVRFCLDDGSTTYTFRCPSCGRRNAKWCSPAIAAILTEKGVGLFPWRLPKELLERRPDRPRT
jgi:predicted RNA-binding Zn-ribbon protein involved in translation (DUF1610 family)